MVSIPRRFSFCTQLNAFIVAGELKVIHGQGMPSQRHHEPGDLYVKISVKFPETIDPAAIPLLERALPPRPPLEEIRQEYCLEEVSLDETDRRQRGRRAG